MAGLWRFTRNRYGRAVYDALTARGVTATWMCEYVCDFEADSDGHLDAVDPDVTVESCDPDRVTPLDAPVEQLVDDERVVAAFDGDTPLGYLFLSVDATLDIEPLERAMTFDGAYVQRVFVAPAHRQRGVASALLDAACRCAREEGAKRATALVALDNAPSRGLFEKHGFEAVRDYRYGRVGPVSARSTREREV